MNERGGRKGKARGYFMFGGTGVPAGRAHGTPGAPRLWYRDDVCTARGAPHRTVTGASAWVVSGSRAAKRYRSVPTGRGHAITKGGGRATGGVCGRVISRFYMTLLNECLCLSHYHLTSVCHLICEASLS